MPARGTTGSSTAIVEIKVDISYDRDPSRFNRLALLLLAPSTDFVIRAST